MDITPTHQHHRGIWGTCAYYNRQTTTKPSLPYHRNLQTNGKLSQVAVKYLFPYYPKQMETRKETSPDTIWLNWKHTNTNQRPPMKIGTKAPHPMSYIHGSKMDIIGILMVWKWFKENPHGNQHLCDFNAAHDLLKASTTHINHKWSTKRFSCNSKQEVASFST